MNGFKEMLKYLRQRDSLSQSELAKKLGVSKSTISMYEVGKREPDFETEEAIADLFNVSLNFLRGKIDKEKGIKIPVLGSVPAGVPIEAIQDIIDYEEIPEQMAILGSYYGLKIKGHSMEPQINDHDIVIVKQVSDVDSGDVAIVMVDGEDATCKKVVKQESGVSLVPFNPNYDPLFFSNKEIEEKPVKIIGKVVELRRKF